MLPADDTAAIFADTVLARLRLAALGRGAGVDLSHCDDHQLVKLLTAAVAQGRIATGAVAVPQTLCLPTAVPPPPPAAAPRAAAAAPASDAQLLAHLPDRRTRADLRPHRRLALRERAGQRVAGTPPRGPAPADAGACCRRGAAAAP